MTERLARMVVASAMIEAAPDGMILVDEVGQILLVNRQVERLFGYRRDDLVGQPVEALLPEGLHCDHRARFWADPPTPATGPGQRRFGRRADGAKFPVEVTVSPLRTASGMRVIAAVRDISNRIAAEAEALQVRKVLDATRDAVLMFDRDSLRFTYVNDGAITQLGYQRDELLTMTPLHIKPTFTEVEFRALIASLSPGQSQSYTTLHRRKDGTSIQVEAVLQHPAADVGGDSGWMVSIARDMTPRLEKEQRTQAVERDLALMADRERIARDLHDRVIQRLFAAGLGIDGLRRRVDDPLVSERLAHVVDELDATIRELRSSIFELTFASPTQSLRVMILDVCAGERAVLGFDPVVRFDGPVDSFGDPLGDHLLAVLREALSNVARHAHATGVQVTVEVGPSLLLRVVDNGVGLTAGVGHRRGQGLGNMMARAHELDGTCDLTPATPSGMTLEWRVPVH